MAGKVVIGVLRGNEPGGAEDGPGVFVGRREDIEGMITGAVGDDEPLVADEDDAGLLGGRPAMAASAQYGASPSRGGRPESGVSAALRS